MRILIAVIAGPHQGQTFRFEGHDVFLVGRSKKARFRLPNSDEYFSRMHFLVEINPPHCRLTDLGSTNGTFVNGQKVAFTDLKDGDLIQGGQTVMRVSIEDSEDEPVTRQAEQLLVVPPPPAVTVIARDASTVLPFAGGSSSSRATDRQDPQTPCTVCGGPVSQALPGSVPEPTRGSSWPLCWTCDEKSRKLEQVFPDYLLIRELGRGGMGVVYFALSQQRGQVAALKTFTPGAAVSRIDLERFLREARILEQLEHPHVVSFREMGEASGQLFFVMDFVAGADAAKIVKRHGPLPIDRAVYLVAQTLEALHYAHGHPSQFVHRDIKPANLLVTPVDGRDFVKVLDFGLARTYQLSRLSGLTMVGQVGGTVAFMAPEQITNFRESRPPVDQYAAAATLYYLLTANYVHDFPTDFTQRLRKILEEDAVPLRSRRPDVPPALADVVHRALAREPADRFPDAAAFRAALLAVLL